jgi:hypothetical protein
MNCIAVIEPKKKTVGTARAWTASHRTVKIGYVVDLFAAIVLGMVSKGWGQLQDGPIRPCTGPRLTYIVCKLGIKGIQSRFDGPRGGFAVPLHSLLHSC